MEKRCNKCGKVLIEEWELYVEKYPGEGELNCCYCGHIETLQ